MFLSVSSLKLKVKKVILDRREAAGKNTMLSNFPVNLTIPWNSPLEKKSVCFRLPKLQILTF